MVADCDVTSVTVTVTGFQKSVIGFDILPFNLRISSGIVYWNTIKMLAGTFFHTGLGLGLGFLEEDLDLDLDLRIVDLHLHLDLAVDGLVTSLL